MKKTGAFLGIIGAILLVVGIYFKVVLSMGGYGTMSSALILAFGREMGMMQNLSTWDIIKMWCAENHAFCIGAGIVGIVLYIVLTNIAAKCEYKQVLENSTVARTWRCSSCGETNPKSRATCAGCGAISTKK